MAEEENKLNNEILGIDEVENGLKNQNLSRAFNKTWLDLLKSLEDQNADEESEELIRNIFIIICYSLIVIVSLIGNLLVCKVVFERKGSRTTTNLLIGNLAVSDLLMTVMNIPFNIARIVLDNWPFGETLCILVPFIQSTSAHCSSITMMVIALERYCSLINRTHIVGNCFGKCFPNRCTHRCLPFGNILFIIWFLSAFFSLPHGIYNQVLEIFTWRKLIRCRVIYPEPSQLFRRRLTLITFLSQYLIPICLTCICYLRIGFFLWRREIVGTVSEGRRLSLIRRKRQRIKMLLMVVCVFATCWLPLNVYHLLTDFNIINYRSSLFLVVHWFAMSSICYNPFIYCWLNENFKSRAKMLFSCISAPNEQINSIPNDTLCDQINLQPIPFDSNRLHESQCRSDSTNNTKLMD
jgi:hypothetical protein